MNLGIHSSLYLNCHHHIVSLQKSVRIRSYSGPYFPTFGLNTERYGVYLRIQSEFGEIRTRITPNTDTFYEVCLVNLVLKFSIHHLTNVRCDTLKKLILIISRGSLIGLLGKGLLSTRLKNEVYLFNKTINPLTPGVH